MIYDFVECVELFGSQYLLKKAIKQKRIYKIKNGVYSTEKKPNDLEVFVKEYPNSVFTMESSLYYLGISDVVPDKYVIASDRDAFKLKKHNIKQFFMNRELVDIGVISINYLGTNIKLFNKERMLIEAIRYKNKLPFDYYKDVINYYRNHIDEINISLVLEYLESFPKKQLISKTIQLEVL